MTTRGNKSTESNRRQYPRLNPEDIPFLKRVEFNQGSEIEIVNISRGGLLLETEARLRPDLKIMLKIVTTTGVLRMDGIILRSSIHSLKGTPKYRTAIAFKQPFDMLDDVKNETMGKTQETTSEFMIPGMHDESDGHGLQEKNYEDKNETDPAILTVIASDANGICLQESFELNDW